jgi:hypothetical protein
MLVAHQILAVGVLAVTVLSAVWAGLVYARHRPASRLLAHLLALAQIVLVAQVGLGLLLLSDHQRAAHRLHYAYGVLALAAVLAPWLYAPEAPRRRLAWFGGATLVAAALAARAYMTSS